MSDETKLVTEVDARKRERCAFEIGSAWRDATPPIEEATYRERAYVQAKLRYPIRREVPREIRDPHGSGSVYRVGTFASHPRIERRHGDEWTTDMGPNLITPERVRAWDALIANPYETVEE